MDIKRKHLNNNTSGYTTSLPCTPRTIKKSMADIPSRAFRDAKFSKAQKHLRSYFNSNLPLPQNQS